MNANEWNVKRVRLFVGGMNPQTTADDLKAHFIADDPALKVYDCVVIVDRETGCSKGYGFIELETTRPMADVIDVMHASVLHNRELTVGVATPKPAKCVVGDKRAGRVEFVKRGGRELHDGAR